MGRYRLGRALEDKSALPGQWLGLHADALWIEILRACIHGAQIALAAIECGHHGVQAGFKTERLHGAMRFDGMAEQEARAEFRAETALIAGRTADLADLHRRSVVAADEAVRSRQHDDAACGLGNRDVEIGRWTRHHRSEERRV